jgi:hypothetical protein
MHAQFFAVLRRRTGEVIAQLAPDQEPQPFAFIMRMDGGVNCYALDRAFFANDEMKDNLAKMMAALAEKDDGVAFAFLCSGWLVRDTSLGRARQIELPAKGSLKTEQGRTEVIFMHEATASGGSCVHYAELKRDGRSAPKLGEWQEMGTTMEARILELVTPIMQRNHARLNS